MYNNSTMLSWWHNISMITVIIEFGIGEYTDFFSK